MIFPFCYKCKKPVTLYQLDKIKILQCECSTHTYDEAWNKQILNAIEQESITFLSKISFLILLIFTVYSLIIDSICILLTFPVTLMLCAILTRKINIFLFNKSLIRVNYSEPKFMVKSINETNIKYVLLFLREQVLFLRSKNVQMAMTELLDKLTSLQKNSDISVQYKIINVTSQLVKMLELNFKNEQIVQSSLNILNNFTFLLDKLNNDIDDESLLRLRVLEKLTTDSVNYHRKGES